MESAKKAAAEDASPCFKKKAEDAGFVATARDHMEQFAATSADKHWICLKKTARRAGDYVQLKKKSISLYGASKAAGGGGGQGGTSGAEEAPSATAAAAAARFHSRG